MRLKISQPALSISARRDEKIAREKRLGKVKVYNMQDAPPFLQSCYPQGSVSSFVLGKRKEYDLLKRAINTSYPLNQGKYLMGLCRNPYSALRPLLSKETVSQFIFVSFRSEARNLDFNKFSTLRFLTYVRNDIFSNYDTVSKEGKKFNPLDDYCFC